MMLLVTLPVWVHVTFGASAAALLGYREKSYKLLFITNVMETHSFSAVNMNKTGEKSRQVILGLSFTKNNDFYS